MQQQQQPQQQNQVGLSHVIKQLAQQIATANQGTNATHVYISNTCTISQANSSDSKSRARHSRNSLNIKNIIL